MDDLPLAPQLAALVASIALIWALTLALARTRLGRGLRLPLTPLSPAHAESAQRTTDLIKQLEQSCRDTLAA